mgnify:CR=1 FL=1
MNTLQALATKALVSDPEALQAMRTTGLAGRCPPDLYAKVNLEALRYEFMALPIEDQKSFFSEHAELWFSPEALAGMIFHGDFELTLSSVMKRMPAWVDMTPLFVAALDYSKSRFMQTIEKDVDYAFLLFELADRLEPEEWIASLTQEHVAQPLMQKFLLRSDLFPPQTSLKWMEVAEEQGREDIVAVMEPMRTKHAQRVRSRSYLRQSSDCEDSTSVLKRKPEQTMLTFLEKWEYQQCRRDLSFFARWK